MNSRSLIPFGRSAATVLIAATVFFGCKSTAALQSVERSHDIVIDGQSDDWAGALTPVRKQNVTVGFMNDGDYLYVAVLASDEAVSRRLMARGLTVWFDAGGNRKKSTGIRYPLGMRPGAGATGDRSGTGARAPGSSLPPGGNAGFRPDFGESLLALELIQGEDSPPRRYPVESVPGVSVKATLDYGTFFCEMKVPLRAAGDRFFAVGAEPGGEVEIGLDSGSTDSEEVASRGQSPGGRGVPGGAGFPGGGGVRGGGGFPGGGDIGGEMGGGESGGQRPFPARAEALSAWFRVALAGS